MPPVQAANGCYDLNDSLYSIISDSEANAVCYTTASEEDVILTMDISGSMYGNKIESAKDAGQFFITMTDINDKIGVVSFSYAEDPNRTRLVYPLTTITADSIKNAASLAIEDLTAFGLTALGEGMQIANNEMIANGDASHEHTIILLSNGKENNGISWSNVEGAVPASTVIHTVGFGPEGDPDEALLSSVRPAWSIANR